jgi:predicted nucleic acid-binding Zn finger protein
MSHNSHVLVLHAVQKIIPERLQRAVSGLADGTLTVNLTGQSETEVKGFVVNGDGKQYGVALTAERAFCSCPDSMFRHSICKHAVSLALHVLRERQDRLRFPIALILRILPWLPCRTQLPIDLQINPIACSSREGMAMATGSEPLGFPQRNAPETGRMPFAPQERLTDLGRLVIGHQHGH